jgi:hypothetical protein
MFHQLSLIVPNQASIPHVVSVKFDHLGPTWLLLIKFDLLLDQSCMNDLVGEMGLRFYRGILVDRKPL